MYSSYAPVKAWHPFKEQNAMRSVFPKPSAETMMKLNILWMQRTDGVQLWAEVIAVDPLVCNTVLLLATEQVNDSTVRATNHFSATYLSHACKSSWRKLKIRFEKFTKSRILHTAY